MIIAKLLFQIAVRQLQHVKGNAGDQKPFGEPCYLCNSAAGDILPDEGTEQTCKGGSEDEVKRNFVR